MSVYNRTLKTNILGNVPETKSKTEKVIHNLKANSFCLIV